MDAPALRAYREGVSKRGLYGTAAVILLVCWAHGAESGLTATAIAGAVYWLSLIFSPRDRHGACNGTGQRHGILFRHAFRRCPRCNSGRIIRLGARFWGLPHIRREAAATGRERALARSERRWR